MPGVTRNQSWIDKNESNRAEAARDFFKSSSLKHYCYMIVESWDSMKEYTLRSSWDKLIDKKEKESSSSTSTEEEIAEVLETMKALSISNGYDNSEIEMWLACDSEDVTFYMLSDNEIIKSITEREEESEEEGDQDDKTETRTCPCSDETFQCLEIALQWFERQREASPLRKTLQAKTDVSGQIGPIVSITSYSKQPAWRPESYAPLVRRDPGAMAEETTKT
ncbi:hypothetical protein M514_10547, partial [Trichuris suis]